jgi:hypothetical protein
VGYIDTATRYIDIDTSIYGRPLSQKIIFSKPIRRLKPIERPAEEAMTYIELSGNI